MPAHGRSAIGGTRTPPTLAMPSFTSRSIVEDTLLGMTTTMANLTGAHHSRSCRFAAQASSCVPPCGRLCRCVDPLPHMDVVAELRCFAPSSRHHCHCSTDQICYLHILGNRSFGLPKLRTSTYLLVLNSAPQWQSYDRNSRGKVQEHDERRTTTTKG